MDPSYLRRLAQASKHVDAMASYQHARTALRSAEAQATPAPRREGSGWRASPDSPAIQALQSEVRKRKASAAAARGVWLAEIIGDAQPLTESNSNQFGFLGPMVDWPWELRLVDHYMPYRRAGLRGPISLRNTLVICEPYHNDEDMSRLRYEWATRLVMDGIAVMVLPKHWCIWAPDNPTSQAVLVGSASLLPFRVS